MIRVMSTQKLPRLVDFRAPESPAECSHDAIPLPEEMKFCTVSPSIWVMWLMVVSPP